FRRAEPGRDRHLPSLPPNAGPARDIAAAFPALAFGCHLYSDLGQEGGIGVAFVQVTFAGGAGSAPLTPRIPKSRGYHPASRSPATRQRTTSLLPAHHIASYGLWRRSH